MSIERRTFIKASGGGSTSTWPSARTSARCQFHAAALAVRDPRRRGGSDQFGRGRTKAEPGSAQGDVSEVAVNRPPGLDVPGRSYFAQATFSDPDGNSWILQEVTNRIPGRTWEA